MRLPDARCSPPPGGGLREPHYEEEWARRLREDDAADHLQRLAAGGGDALPARAYHYSEGQGLFGMWRWKGGDCVGLASGIAEKDWGLYASTETRAAETS